MFNEEKVDMRKVNLQVIRPWITNKVVELVGIEDEVVVEYAMGLLEDESKPVSCHCCHYTNPRLLNLHHHRLLTPKRCKLILLASSRHPLPLL
jgi:PWI domain